MNFAFVIDFVLTMLKHVGIDPTNPDAWKVSVDGKKSGPVKKVTAASNGIKMTFTHLGSDVTLEAKPTASPVAEVWVNGTKEPNARLKPDKRHQLGKPIILLLIWENVPIAGIPSKVRFDIPK